MEIRIENVPKMRVAFVRHIGPYNECETAWEKLCGWAAPKGLFTPDAKILGLAHDNPEETPPEKIRYDACVTVGDDVQPEGEVGVQEIRGGDYAIYLHKGPYEKLAGVYEELYTRAIPASGREFAFDPCFEVYVNDPRSTPPEELMTEIYVPLKPKA